MSRRVSAVAPTRVIGKPPLGVPNGMKPGLPQRRASFHGGKRSQSRTDPRPLNDRGFQQEEYPHFEGHMLHRGPPPPNPKAGRVEAPDPSLPKPLLAAH